MKTIQNITPLIYASFSLPVLFGTFYITDFAQRTLSLYFSFFDFFEIEFVFLVFGSLMFLAGNYLILRMENPNKKFTLIHFRQSSIYYVVFIIFLVGLIKYGEIGSRGSEALIIAMSVSILAIIINALSIFVYTKINK